MTRLTSFVCVPNWVIVPNASASKICPGARLPVDTVTKALVNGVPSYVFSPEPVLIVIGRRETDNVPTVFVTA